MCIPRGSKGKREKLIKPTPLCQGIKCSLGPGFEANKCTSTGLLVLIQFIVERGNEVKSGAGALESTLPSFVVPGKVARIVGGNDR